jgi:hypothetical protein
MGQMVREQRKSCKASPFNTPAANFHTVNPYQLDATETSKAGRQQVSPYGLTL